MKPRREFNADEGDFSVSLSGPDAIENDIDTINRMFDPETTHFDSSPGGIAEENMQVAAATDKIIGDRVIDDLIVDEYENTGKLSKLLSLIGKTIKSLKGTNSWSEEPNDSINGLDTRVTDNTDEIVRHIDSNDHDNRYYTKELLNQGQLDNRYHSKESIKSGALNELYYTKPQLSPFLAGGSVPVYTEKYIIVSSDNEDGTFTYNYKGEDVIGNIVDDMQVFTIKDNNYPSGNDSLLVYVDGIPFKSIEGNEVIELSDTTFGLKPLQASDMVITIKYVNKTGIIAVDNVIQQLSDIEQEVIELKEDMDYVVDVELDSKADLDVTGNVPVEQLENVRDMKDFYGRDVKRIDTNLPVNILLDNNIEFDMLKYMNLSKTAGGGGTNSLTVLDDSIILHTNHTSATYVYCHSDEQIDLTDIDYVDISYYTTAVATPQYTEFSFGFTDVIENINYSTIGYDVGFSTKNVNQFIATEIDDYIPVVQRLNVSELNGLYYFKCAAFHSIASLQVRLYINDVRFIKENTNLKSNNGKLELADNLNYILELPQQEMPSKFLDWYNLNALVDTPPGTSVRFDIYDKYDNLLRGDVKQGEILKLTEPIIKPKVTLSRNTLETPSPTFSWLEIGMRGLGDSTLLFGRDVKRYEASEVNVEEHRMLSNIGVMAEYNHVGVSTPISVIGTQLENLNLKLLHRTTTNKPVIMCNTGNIQFGVNHNNTSLSALIGSTIEPYDLTNIDTLEIKYSTSSNGVSRFGIQETLTTSSTAFDASVIADHTKDTVSLDVRAFTGFYHLKLACSTNTASNLSTYIYAINLKHTSMIDVGVDNIRLTDNFLAHPINLPPITIQPNFSEWHGLNALVDTPPNTKVRFDIYDKYGNLLEDDIKNGEKFKNFTYPEIYPRVTLTRDSLETPSPTFSWLEIGWLGSASGTIWQKIDEITLDVDTAQLDIDVSYFKDVRILIKNLQSDGAAIPKMRFNSSTLSEYSSGRIQSSSTTVTANNNVETQIDLLTNTWLISGSPSHFEIYIYGLTEGERTFGNFFAVCPNGQGGTGRFSFNTSKINIINFFASTSRLFKAGATFEIWGR